MFKKKTSTTGDSLRAAASKGCLAAVRFLVEEGVSTNETDEQGRTPMILATQNNHLAVVQFLEEQQPTGNDPNDLLLLMKEESNVHYALNAAIQRGDIGTARFLIEEGVRIDKANKKGKTHLMCGAENGHHHRS